MEEIWKDIEGYEGLYQVSNYGKVRSLNYRGNGRVQELKPASDKNGYLVVSLYKGGKHKLYKVHRLVGQMFIPNPQDLPVINHLDRNPLNNHVNNLEYCTQRHNVVYSKGKSVLQFTKDGVLVGEFDSTREASRKIGVSQNSISRCCLGQPHYLTAGGYVWRYKN